VGCNELQRRFVRISAEITAGKDAGKKAAASWAEEGAQAKAYATKPAGAKSSCPIRRTSGS